MALENLDDGIAAVRHILDEENPANTHWKDPRITIFLNDAGDDAATRIPGALMPKLGVSETKHLSQNIADYTFDTERIKIDHILLNYIGGNLKLKDYYYARVVDVSYINVFKNNPLHEPKTTNPFVTIHGPTLTVYPTPLTLAQNGMKILFTKPATAMVKGTDVPDLPKFAYYWLVIEAASKCLQEDGIPAWEGYHNQYEAKFDRFKGGNQ